MSDKNPVVVCPKCKSTNILLGKVSHDFEMMPDATYDIAYYE